MAPALDAGTSVWRPSSPGSIEADLAALWRETSRAGPLSRALMSNLVVISPRRLFPGVEDVARRHPARTIMLAITSGVDDAAPPDAARIGLLTFGEAAARYGVELMAIHTICADESIPSIVRRLSRGDVPTTVWWMGDLSSPAPSPALTTMGRQLVYDSADWQDLDAGVAAVCSLIRHPHAPDLVDLNWRRVGALRAGIAHALRAETRAGVYPTSASIQCRADRASAARLMAGWLISRVKGIERQQRMVDATLDGNEWLTVTLAAPGWTLSAAMADEQVVVQVTGRPPFAMPVPAETGADAVAAELCNLAKDAGLTDALTALA